MSPASGAAQDFTAPVVYTVTASDLTTKAYTVTVSVSDDDQATTTGSFVIHVLAYGPTKYLVVDQPDHAIFRYDQVGNFLQLIHQERLPEPVEKLRGVAPRDLYWEWNPGSRTFPTRSGNT